ncbi:MAG: SMP-30/gluconolactonase/LRE family protein [Micromonosporaceae bacterium]
MSAFETLVDPQAQLTKLARLDTFTEGPVWSPRESCLYFSEIPGDTRWRWTRERGLEAVARPCFKGDGLVLDAGGALIASEHVTSSVARITADGKREVLAFHHRGRYLNSPNDVTTRAADGAIYFTDPDFGRWNNAVGVKRDPELAYKGVYRVPANGGGEAELLVDESEFDQPNGLCFSPDERILYVNDSPRAHVKAFPVRGDGTLGDGHVFFEGIGDGDGRKGAPDGMKCDQHGNVWCTGPGGIWILSPGGEHLGTLATPEFITNLAWGGPGWRCLFLTGTTSLYSVSTHVASARLPYF